MNQHDYPPIDILLVCYQQERYITQAVESIQSQTYPGRMRVIVADDYSTDETTQRIRRQAQARPDIPFVFLQSDRNLGYPKNYQRAFASPQENYVAILEGDDYWLDEGKLTKQIQFLEANPDCVMCGCNCFLRDEETGATTSVNQRTIGITKFDSHAEIRDVVVCNFSTGVYRRQALESLPPAVFDSIFGDWIVNICCGLEGLLGYLHEPLSVHRLHAKALWSGLSEHEQLVKLINWSYDYDRITAGQFHEDFRNRRAVLAAALA